jgi:hypothetical protein
MAKALGLLAHEHEQFRCLMASVDIEVEDVLADSILAANCGKRKFRRLWQPFAQSVLGCIDMAGFVNDAVR